MATRTISLFAGCGTLDLAVRLALPDARTVCYVETELTAARILAARITDGSLDDAPIWSDVRTFDARRWRGSVDCIAGGFPCQDISVAGRGEGIVEGNRSGLWFEFARIIREIRPRLVILENVGAITIRGLDTVLGDLAESGYDAEWLCLRASDMGASHRRERWFCVAAEREYCLKHSMADAVFDRIRDERYRKAGRNSTVGEISDSLSEIGDNGDSQPGRLRKQFLANGAERGCGIVRESSGCDGFADGGDGAMDDASWHEWTGSFGEVGGGWRVRTAGDAMEDAGRAGSGRPAEPAGIEGRRPPGDDCGAGRALGNSAGARLGNRESRPGGKVWDEAWRPQPSGRRDDLADLASPRLEEWGCIVGDSGEERAAAERNCKPMADTSIGQLSLTGRGPERRNGAGSAGERLPVFAPGPSDPRWPAILAQHPHLAPATESGVRGLVDGAAVVVDASRTDSLRALGNSVVAIQGAAAIRELLRRIE